MLAPVEFLADITPFRFPTEKLNEFVVLFVEI
jgi:hypothetical protein